jgi:ABC-type glutathione transport system ATPase component
MPRGRRVTALLAADSLLYRFGRATAVDQVSLALHEGEAVGLVGESGSGKSTLLRLLLRLQPADGGRVLCCGTEVTHATGTGLRMLRQTVQAVFQNPHAALNPRATVLSAVSEPLRLQGGLGRAAVVDRVCQLLEDVGLSEDFLWRYPHELSGGQSQRVCIARALAPRPRALLLDEPTSALDVSVQAQIIALLADLRVRHGLAMLFVSHNLALVRLLCTRVAVLRAGVLVEQGPAAALFAAPQHGYTRSLLAAILPTLPGPPAQAPAASSPAASSPAAG